ncbi:MAG: leucine-rich repeat domain-containing protein, partial [Muribaculaceae bacterium]|nr:leucine-rich repeat domain-containing protein [Muribaculaceae bacterium]
ANIWSDIHITSDERQPGLTMDVEDISSAASFSVRAGALKNISNTDFSGKLAVALFDSEGHRKALLNDGSNFNLIALQIHKFVDFSCKVPAGVTVADGDVVRLVTMANGSNDWIPVSGDLLACGEAPAKGYSYPYFFVTLPGASNDYEVSNAADKVIKGRDYTFTVKPLSVDKVITVKANGFILTPDANNGYRISNVLEDQKITMVVQDAKDVLSKKVVWTTAGNLQDQISETESATVTDLTIFGTINVNDFNFMRDRMKLERLDISQTSILASGSMPANAIPTKAFQNYRSLKQIILPNNLTTFKNGCLSCTGLTSIDIPASVGTWEYNVFVGCYSLHEVIVRRSSPAWINWCVFNGDPRDLLIVPNGAAEAYKNKEYWQDFKEIREGLPELPSKFSVTVAEKKGLNFTSLTEGVEFQRGDQYKFRVETDNSFEDAIMQVYANSTRLTPDADGVYTATINANTLIHVEFQQPQATTVDKTWKLTGEGGGIGLVTDIVNVPLGKTFTVRANAIKIPKGDDAAKFYGMVLTDKNGAIKEFISTVLSNYYSRAEAVVSYNFYCQVKEASIKEGNQIHLATSYNKKDWQLVEGDADSIQCSLAAVGNQVAYHSVTMPASVNGARIEGAATQVVRGMPFNLKVSAINPAQRVTVGINGITKAGRVATANINVPAVLEDLDVTILVSDADAGDYMVYNIQEGQLAAKLAADCPPRVKLVGSMYVSDFNALRANASKIIDLDMSEVTIKGAAMTGNQLPENAFAPSNVSDISALKTVILPNNLERIEKNALARCTQITEITIPANVSYIG